MLQTEQHNAPQPPLTLRGGVEGEQPALFLPFRFFPAEREVAARKERLTVSEWAEKYRVVTKSRLKGPWRNENNPALVGIMDTYSLAYVREIVLCKGVQTGGPLALDTLVPTVTGWTMMGDIKVGERIFDETGAICEVLGVSPIFYDRQCYQITFDDGSDIVCDGSHLWTVIDNKRGYRSITLTTDKISGTYLSNKKRGAHRYSIPITKPLVLPDAEFPISPYALGVWLGDGSNASNQVTTHEDDAQEITEYLIASGHKTINRKPAWVKGKCRNLIIEPKEKAPNICLRGHDTRIVGVRQLKDGGTCCAECHRQFARYYKYKKPMDPVIPAPDGFHKKLANLNLIQNKHIPGQYLRSSYKQRLELLQGLMDTDGYISSEGACEITIANERLKNDVYELLMSLGIKARVKERKCIKTSWGLIANPKTHYKIFFQVYGLQVCKLRRKLKYLSTQKGTATSRYAAKNQKRFIVDVVPVENVPVRCIKTSSPNNLFLVGGSMIATHNTEMAYNCLGYEMERSSDMALFVMADESSAKNQMNTRIIPMLEKSPQLARLKSSNPYDITQKGIALKHGFNLKIGWGTSLVSVASDPCRIVLIDEADKFDQPVIFEEAKARTTTYAETCKIIVLSVPRMENGVLMQEFNACDEVRDYHVPCPSCGVMEPMKLDNIKCPEGQNYKQVRRHESAWYECPHCNAKWNDYKRQEALKSGEWVARTPVHRPKAVGFHFPSWISPFISLSEIAARWIKAKEALAKGDQEPMRVFVNNIAAEAYVNEKSERKEDAILALRDDRPRGLAPKDLSCLMLFADTQQKGLYYEVVAFGWGQSLETWQVREGYVETFEGLKQIAMSDEYLDIEGQRHVVEFAFIDSGGGTGTTPKHSRTVEVYDFCRLNPLFHPLKGRQTMTAPYKASKIDNYPGTNRPIPGGLTLYNINVTYFKNHLATKLQVNPEDPGAWHLNSEATEDYARQMCAEYQDDRGHWQCPRNKANHFWDLGVYRLAAAEIVGVRFWKREEDAPAPQDRGKDKKEAQKAKNKGRW